MKQYNRIMLGKKSCYAEECRKGGYIATDFLNGINLSGQFPDSWREFNEAFIPIWLNRNPNKSKVAAGLSCSFLWTICKGLNVGDVVLCPNGKGYYYVGVIASDYYFVKGQNSHRRKVDWMEKVIARADMSERLRNTTGAIGTCSDCTKYADEIEELISSASSSVNPTSSYDIIDIEQDQDPEALIKETYNQLQNKLVDELLDYVITLSPTQFEKLVLGLLVKMGYGDAIHTGQSGDEGIDGIIEEDKLGIDEIHIQAKRYKIGNNIGRDMLQAFVGALAGQNARKGVFITTSDFTKQAREYKPNGVKIVKINGVRLAKLMIEYNIGVRSKEIYEVKSLDRSFFEE